MKFLLDENVHKGLYFFLTKLGYNVKLSPKTIENGEVFKLTLNDGRVLITRDSHFIKTSYASSEHFGIWLLRVPPEDLEAQERAISNLLKSTKEFKSRVIILFSDKKFEFVK